MLNVEKKFMTGIYIINGMFIKLQAAVFHFQKTSEINGGAGTVGEFVPNGTETTLIGFYPSYAKSMTYFTFST